MNCGSDSYSDNKRFHTEYFGLTSSGSAVAHVAVDLGSLGSESPDVGWLGFQAPAPMASGIVMLPLPLFVALLLGYLLVTLLDDLLAQIPTDSLH